jgi:hypothetical protein
MQAQVVQMSAQMVQATMIAFSMQTLGALMAGVDVTKPLVGQKPTDQGIVALRGIYGSEIVDAAIKTFPDADIVTLATMVDSLAVSHLEDKYGKSAVAAAQAMTEPLDYKGAERVAIAVSNALRTTTSLPPQQAAVKVAEAAKAAKGRTKGVHVRDNKTGIEYDSHGKAGKALAAEFGIAADPNGWCWYPILKMAGNPNDPHYYANRFTDTGSGKAPTTGTIFPKA